MAKRILSLFLVLACLPILTYAQTGFSANVTAINEAALSVLMLETMRGGETIATGSGFVAFNNRTLVTNRHVIEGADTIFAFSDDGYSFILDKVIAEDEKADLAILGFFSPTDRKPLPLNAGEILRAEPVVAIGSPKGMLNTVSMGNVSAVFEDGGVSYVQFTAAISSGSSGGALFNDRGEVIGVTTAAYDDGNGVVQNLNFAVDAREVARLGAEMDESKSVWLDDYQNGAKPGRAPEPVETPAPTARPTPKPSPTPTAGPAHILSDVSVERVKKSTYRIIWKDTVRESPLDYYISYRQADTADVHTLHAKTVSQAGDTLSTILETDLSAGKDYIFAVGLSEEASVAAANADVPAQNACIYRLEAASANQYNELKEGDFGYEVVEMQLALIRLGYLEGSADGAFGKQTAQAVYDFKVANGISIFQPYVATSGMLEKLYGSEAVASGEAAFALEIPDDGYGQWEAVSGDKLKMRVQVRNTSKNRTVKAFELYVYATDESGALLYGSDMIYFATTTEDVAPGQTAYSDYITIPNRSKIDQACVGISKIVYSDGTEMNASSVDYHIWEIE